MKSFLFLLLFFLFTTGCQQEKFSEKETRNQNIITEELSKQIQFDVKVLVGEFDKQVRKSGYHQADKKLLKQVNQVTAWKNGYLEKRTDDNLLAYSNSILNLSSKLKISSEWQDKSKIALYQIRKYKSKFKDNPTETNHIQLFFWTLKAELDYLMYSSQFIGFTTTSYNRLIMGWANSNIIELGDTMYFIMEPSPAQEYFDKALIYKAGKTYYEHKKTGTKTSLKPIKIGQKFLFLIKPKQTGKFELNGQLILDSIDTSTGRDCTLVMKTDFMVH